ncbi:MAG TPA: hypothetical protein DCE42_28345 [Myxococcales bacterium]|nr:hypothetical protein [Myxococcales bacterium]
MLVNKGPLETTNFNISFTSLHHMIPTKPLEAYARTTRAVLPLIGSKKKVKRGTKENHQTQKHHSQNAIQIKNLNTENKKKSANL